MGREDFSELSSKSSCVREGDTWYNFLLVLTFVGC